MTEELFNKTGFYSGIKALLYNGEMLLVQSVDFEEGISELIEEGKAGNIAIIKRHFRYIKRFV